VVLSSCACLVSLPSLAVLLFVCLFLFLLLLILLFANEMTLVRICSVRKVPTTSRRDPLLPDATSCSFVLLACRVVVVAACLVGVGVVGATRGVYGWCEKRGCVGIGVGDGGCYSWCSTTAPACGVGAAAHSLEHWQCRSDVFGLWRIAGMHRCIQGIISCRLVVSLCWQLAPLVATLMAIALVLTTSVHSLSVLSHCSASTTTAAMTTH
jgi:hypothetical protein